MNRTEALQSIRPHIQLENENADGLEKFQNETLRSILKFQNEAILSITQNALLSQYKLFSTWGIAEKTQKVEVYIKTNQSLKKTLIGIIIGHFTAGELAFYFSHEAEINKRLQIFIFKRITDQINAL